jgi:hypothetical protein
MSAAEEAPVIDRAWLASRGLLSRVVREQAIDHAIESIVLAPIERDAACTAASEQWKDEGARAQLERIGMCLDDLIAVEERRKRIRKFQEETWKASLPTYFLKRKSALDQVVYWLLRTDDRLLARELYFRLKEGEEDFASLAAKHSLGSEAMTCGMLGPSAIGSLAPALGKLLIESEPGIVRQPVQIGDWTVIVRLERILPCQLDADMEDRLYDELLDAWVAEHLPERS